MTFRSMGAALLALSATTALPAAAQVIIAPVAAVIDSGGPGSGSINDTFNQSGLSAGYTAGVTNFDSYIASNPTHTSAFAGNEWFGNFGTTTAVVTYDLGSAQTIDRLALWNEESSGIGLLSLLGSTDNVTFTALGTYSPVDVPLADYPAQVFSFAATSLRYLRFDMSGCPQPNPGSYQSCAIGEVAFRTAGIAVPEPASWAMMIGGLALVGGALRRRKAASVRYA